MNLEKALYSSAETAKIINQSVKKVYRLVDEGRLKRVKFSRHLLITRESILALLADVR